MRAHILHDRTAGRVTIEPSAEEYDNHDGRFHGGHVTFDLPFTRDEIHPDLLALSTILVLHPFVGHRLSIDLAVSDQFREACSAWLSYDCEFLDDVGPGVAPRPRGTAPGLSFSGGMDSVAALALMPRDTRAIFLDRVTTWDFTSRSLYDNDSAYAACSMLEDRGYAVYKVPTTLEYIRRPVGFPVDWSCGVPAILLADHLDLASIAWGIVAESAYRVGSEGFQDFPVRAIFRRWDALLRAVGLELSAPVAGVSEVGTSTIERHSHLAGVGQSCIRGPKGAPCQQCKKCVRKVLLDAVLADEKISASTVDHLLRFPGYEKILLAEPIKHEDVFRWTAPRLKVSGRSAAWSAFQDRLDVGDLDPSWCHAWYAPSSDVIAPEYRDWSVEQVERYLPRQDDRESSLFEAWDMAPVVADPSFAPAQGRLRDALLTPAPADGLLQR